MVEIPLVVLILFLAIFFALGAIAGQTVESATRDARRRRALAKAIPVWEVHAGTDARDYGLGIRSPGDYLIISVRKVRRAGSYSELLQEVEVARLRGKENPDEILLAVDRAQTLCNTLALTGVA